MKIITLNTWVASREGSQNKLIYMNNKITIATHGGKFHSDDVFAVAVLKLIFSDKKITLLRTRDEEFIKNANYVVDIGGVYDAENNKFDHHQIGGAGERENGIQYASFGLVWKKFGEQLCGSKEVALYLDKKIVQSVDAGDNGIDISKAIFSEVFPYTIGSIINSYRPTWKETEKDLNDEFENVVEFAKSVLEREIEIASHIIEAQKIVGEYYKNAEDKRLIILDNENDSFGREIVGGKLLEYSEPIYAVTYRPDAGNWQTVAINKSQNTFEARKSLPEAWRGLRDEELSKVTGLDDVVFCHRTGFMCVSKSKESAIKLAKMALEI